MNKKQKKILSYLNLGLDFVEIEKLVNINRYDIESFVNEKLEVKDGVYYLAETKEVKEKTEIEQCIENIGGSKRDYDYIKKTVEEIAMVLFKSIHKMSKKQNDTENGFIEYNPFVFKKRAGSVLAKRFKEVCAYKDRWGSNYMAAKELDVTLKTLEIFIENYLDVVDGKLVKNSYYKKLRLGNYNNSGACLLNHEDILLKLLNDGLDHVEIRKKTGLSSTNVRAYTRNFTKKVNGIYVRNID